MGRQSRRKRERREAESPESREFRRHLQIEEAQVKAGELAARRDAPCIVCQRLGSELVGVWEVGARFARTLGVPAGKQRVYFYKICHECHRKAADGDRWIREFIEAAIIARERGENIVYLGADGMPIIEPAEESS